MHLSGREHAAELMAILRYGAIPIYRRASGVWERYLNGGHYLGSIAAMYGAHME
jgi:hypothetical protein